MQISWKGGSEKSSSEKVEVVLRCRTQKQSFVFTFEDHDGAVSHAAAIAPRHNCKRFFCLCVFCVFVVLILVIDSFWFCGLFSILNWSFIDTSEEGCAVLVSLSGVGATATTNADAHKFVSSEVCFDHFY